VNKTYDIYLLRCADDSLYCGIATDWQTRFEEHCSKGVKGAKYTKSHTAVAVERVWRAPDRATASRLEYRIKRLKKPQKEALAARRLSLSDVFGETLDVSIYNKIT